MPRLHAIYSNIVLVLREVQDEVYKNKQNVVEYKHEFKASLKENEIKQLLVALEKRYEGRINIIIKYKKSCEFKRILIQQQTVVKAFLIIFLYKDFSQTILKSPAIKISQLLSHISLITSSNISHNSASL